jgi:hypothetical protein
MDKLLKKIVVNFIARENGVSYDDDIEIDLVESIKQNPGEIHEKVNDIFIDVIPNESSIFVSVSGKGWIQRYTITEKEGRVLNCDF